MSSTQTERKYYLPEGLPAPAPAADNLEKPFWDGVNRHELMVQRCNACQTWQFGPEWVCHNCLSFDVGWEKVEPRGKVYSWERAWYPVHPALRDGVPYIVVLVELPQAGKVRMVGNLLGDPEQGVVIGSDVEAVFEDHEGPGEPYTLVQWKTV